MADGASRGQRAFNFPRRAHVSALRPGEIVADLFAGGGGASEALHQAIGRVVKLDGSIAAAGERVPISEQFLIPDKRREGRAWQHFVAALRTLGYAVEWRKLRACDYGAGTSRTRLFMIARCDGEAIRWPAPTHASKQAICANPQIGLSPYVTAADCIDWSIPCPSIFERRKPLAEATMRRIARGVRKFVLEAAEPFIVPNNTNNAPQPVSDPLPTLTTCQGRNLLVEPVFAPVLTEHANASRAASWRADEPLRTQCAQVKGGHFAMAAATLVQAAYGEGRGPTKRRGSGAHDVEQPVGTIHAGGGSFAIATAFLEQAAGGPNSNTSPPRGADEPLSTITQSGSQQRLVTANMVTMRGDNVGAPTTEPVRTLTAGGEHHAVVECTLSPEHEAGALRVAAFLVNYYGNGQALDCRDPLDTVTTRDRLALVTVQVRGVPYVIVDIGLRMLRPAELYRAQGFPADYIIDRTADGRPINATRAVRMVGNSVSPPPLAAIARANLGIAIEQRAAA
jgi:DNA (cytosine-5)-methyltransferase 1